MRRVAYAAPRQHRSLLGVALSHVPSVRRLAARALPVAREHLGTVAGLAAIDWGCWAAGRIPGLIVTGVSVLLLDFAVRG